MVRQRQRWHDLSPEEEKGTRRAARQMELAPMAEQAKPGASLFLAQHALGNQAVQRILAQNTLPPNGAVLAHFLGGREALTRAVARAVVSEALPRREAEGEAIQRQEEETGEQTQADTGTVTIGDVTSDYYDVTGSTLADVYGQLDPEEWGRCHYQYDYSYDSANGRTTRVNITLALTIRFPRWQGAGWDSASPAAQAEWRRMLQALQTHEEEHAAIARRWAPTFQQRLLGQRENRVQQRFDQVLRDAKKEQKQFDQRTRHGQTQGVSLDTSIQ